MPLARDASDVSGERFANENLNYNDIGNIITNSKVGDYIYPATRTCTANPDPGNTCCEKGRDGDHSGTLHPRDAR